MPKEIAKIRDLLIRWFREEGRQLPWRETTDPYRILVSELMLQQTQVKTVLDYYKRWLERFPTLEQLAAAEEAEALNVWQGLGYYRRARNLHRCAKILVERGSIFPKSVDEWIELPGIGRYTAGAVLSFAFNLSAPIVDGNVTRVLSRLFNIETPIEESKTRSRLWELAEVLADCREPRLLNSALMELGALVCTPRRPDCLNCPIKRHCRSNAPELLPMKKKGPGITSTSEPYLWVERKGQLLLELQTGKRWNGLWCLPRADGHSDLGVALMTLSHSITRYRVNLEVYRKDHTEMVETAGTTWVAWDQLDRFPMPTPHRKAVAAIWKVRLNEPR
jgi:A/G-specific adenine glycosylase